MAMEITTNAAPEIVQDTYRKSHPCCVGQKVTGRPYIIGAKFSVSGVKVG